MSEDVYPVVILLDAFNDLRDEYHPVKTCRVHEIPAACTHAGKTGDKDIISLIIKSLCGRSEFSGVSCITVNAQYAFLSLPVMPHHK